MVVRTIGVVRGATVRARHLGKDLLAEFKGMIGGVIEGYTKLLAESRDQAIDRMVANARDMGANALINTRFSTSYIMAIAAAIMVFGTAVVLEDA